MLDNIEEFARKHGVPPEKVEAIKARVRRDLLVMIDHPEPTSRAAVEAFHQTKTGREWLVAEIRRLTARLDRATAFEVPWPNAEQGDRLPLRIERRRQDGGFRWAVECGQMVLRHDGAWECKLSHP